MEESHALITNDAVVLGLLMALLAFVFRTSSSDNPSLKKFYGIVPMLLLCYFLPSLLNTFNIVDGELVLVLGENEMGSFALTDCELRDDLAASGNF